MATSKKSTEAVKTEENAKVSITVSTQEKNENDGNIEATDANNEVTYTVAEFAGASKTVFDKPYSPDIINAAFKTARKTSATKREAAKIVSKFL